jgi:hypothetical protein
MGEAAVQAGQRIDLLFTPMVRSWGGSSTVEARLRDVRPAAAPSPRATEP